MRNIAVIGGGVVGLSSAVRIAEHYAEDAGVQVTLMANEMTPHTTGDGAAGLWGPYLYGSTPLENISKWGGDTHSFFYDLWFTGFASEVGITVLPVVQVTSDAGGFPDPLWKDIVFGFRHLDEYELKQLGNQHGKVYTDGYQYTTMTCEPTRLLPYLFKRFEAAGGKFEKRFVESFDELFAEPIGYDIIVNCSGLGARILAKDNLVRPIRGQVGRVKAPFMYRVIMDDSEDGNYIIPNINSVVIGGTHQVDDYNTNVSPEDSKAIMDGCVNLVPALAGVELLTEWVGLRPGRDSVRVEPGVHKTKTGREIPIIHNYGHGGCGITLCWGCAADVLDFVKDSYNKLEQRSIKSKL